MTVPAIATSAEVTGGVPVDTEARSLCAGGIWLRKAARMSCGHLCAGGLWLGEGGKDGGDGSVADGICFCGCNQRGAGGRVPVGFGPRRRSDNEARLFVGWWDLAQRE